MKNHYIALTILFIALLSIPITIVNEQKQTILKNYAQEYRSDPTVLNLTVYLHGIGNSGDSVNPTSNDLSTKVPMHSSREVIVSLYNTSNQLIKKQTGYVYFVQSNGNFSGSVDMGTTLPTGNYIIKIKSNGYLQRRVPGTVYAKTASETSVPAVSLVAGDLNGDNALNALDYNMLMGCYSDILSPKFCDQSRQELADFSSDNTVDMLDYNLFLRELPVQNGD